MLVFRSYQSTWMLASGWLHVHFLGRRSFLVDNRGSRFSSYHGLSTTPHKIPLTCRHAPRVQLWPEQLGSSAVALHHLHALQQRLAIGQHPSSRLQPYRAIGQQLPSRPAVGLRPRGGEHDRALVGEIPPHVIPLGFSRGFPPQAP